MNCRNEERWSIYSYYEIASKRTKKTSRQPSSISVTTTYLNKPDFGTSTDTFFACNSTISACAVQRCEAAALTPHRCRCTISSRGCFTSSIDCSAQVNGIAGGCPRNTAPTLLHVTLPQLSSRPRRGRVAACADGGDWRVSCSVALTRHPVPRSPARVYRACCKKCSAA